MILSRACVLAAALMALAGSAVADDHKPEPPGPWKYVVGLGLNLSQSEFSSNWAGGDRGALVWVFSSQSTAERQFSTTFNWTNSLKLAYGQTANQARTSAGLHWESPDKTTDAIAFESLGRWTLGGPLDPYFAFDAASQFEDQSDPRGTIDFNPIELKESAGAARMLYRTDDSQALTRLGFGFREVLAKAFTDPLGQSRRSFSSEDGGIEWQTDVTQPTLHKKVLYKGTLLVRQPVFYSKKDDLKKVDDALRAAYAGRESIADFWKATRVNFDNNFAAPITKNLGVNLAVTWVYVKFDAAALVDPALAASADPAVRDAYARQIDKNVRKAGQFREVLSLAITYRLL
ncbi:MAG TPA: DUF3078 domain-containing protein [Candidatus Eisenbacteria bacterium]|nr:DUF3078 domain-containing protein [Candidatus Eisenbacteria bacterium]